MDIRIFIAGAAGEGIQTIGSLLARVIQAQGVLLFSAGRNSNPGFGAGQNSYRLRVSETPLNAPTGKADILLSMNPGASQKYLPLLDDKGILLAAASAGYDNEIMIPFVEIAREDFGKGIYANTVAIGAVCGMLGIKDSQLANIIQETFAQKEGRHHSDQSGGCRKRLHAGPGRLHRQMPMATESESGALLPDPGS